MRILDCKSPICSEIAKDAPVILDYLCDECKDHFDKLKGYLERMGIAYTVDPTIVRGLDYYTKTVFEFVTDATGTKSTICGGGRYDGLIEQLGGQKTPAMGFGMGLERLILTMECQGLPFEEEKPCDLYIAPMDSDAVPFAIDLIQSVRSEGFRAEFDTMGRGLKAQMKFADKLGCTFVLVLGGNEIETKQAKLKNMKTGEETPITLDDKFSENFSNICIGEMFSGTLE